MSEEGSSPGGGAAPTPPADAPAQAPTLDVAALVAQITTHLTGVFDEKLTSQKNEIFANLRRTGVLSKQSSAADQPAPQQSAPASAPSGVSHTEMQSALERERVFSARAAKHGLTEAQDRRMRAALATAPLESFGSEVDAYLADMGLAKTPPPATATADNNKPAQTQAPEQKQRPNSSDMGGAAPTNLRDSESIALSRPREISSHDFDTLVAKHGQAKAMSMFTEAVMRDLRTFRLTPESRRQR